MAKKKSKPIRPNPFKGADDIYLTKNKIAVVSVESTSTPRGHVMVKKTKYYAQNDGNLKQLKAAQGDTIQVGRKGNKFKRI